MDTPISSFNDWQWLCFFRDRAAYCRTQAAGASNNELRQRWLALAAEWDDHARVKKAAAVRH